MEPPEGKLASFKDFLKHYAMIVLSILTALGLEAAVEAWHHHAEAVEASHAIEHELRGDLAETRRAIEDNREQLPRLRSLHAALRAAIAAGRPAEEIRASVIAPALDEVAGVSLSLPRVDQAAWERAIANHSATWLDEQSLDRYSAAYASSREIMGSIFNIFTAFSSPGELVQVLDDARDRRVDPVAFMHAMRGYQTALGTAQNNLYELDRKLAAAVGERPLRPATASATPAASAAAD